MATAPPSKKPYRAISAAEGEDYDGNISNGPSPSVFRDDPHSSDANHSSGDTMTIATQSIDLELEQDDSELYQRERSFKYKILFAMCFLGALAFGGREYYMKTYTQNDDGSGSSLTGLGSSSNIRGSGSSSGSSDVFDIENSDLSEEQIEELEEEIEELLEDADNIEGGMFQDLLDGEQYDDGLGGEVLYEGDVDDEINSGELGGVQFDNDMNYEDSLDQVQDEAIYNDDEDKEEDEGYPYYDLEDQDNESVEEFVYEQGAGASSFDFDVDTENSIDESQEEGDVVEYNETSEDGEGEEFISDGKIIESEDIEDGLDEIPSDSQDADELEGGDFLDEDSLEGDSVDTVIESNSVDQDADESGSVDGDVNTVKSSAIEEEELSTEELAEGNPQEVVPPADDTSNEKGSESEGGETGDSADEVATENGGQDENPSDEELPAETTEVKTAEELPDYFIPLTPDEREDMKEMLRSILRTTKDSLLLSANNNSTPGDEKESFQNPTPQRTLVLDSDLPKQFMHMHHMKTGGTSVDGLINCALRRQKELHDGTSINYNRMSECGSRVKSCMNTLAKELNASVVENVFYYNNKQGDAQVDTEFSFDPADEDLGLPIDELNVCQCSEANVMSYCASLHAVRTFGWKAVDKITMIRNPVDRAWSMYKFSLNSCYKCQEMKDVLLKVENGTFVRGGGVSAEQNFVYSPNDSCAVQMIGHQATNLLSSQDMYNIANDVRFPREQEIVEEAVRNLREEFTWIGITDRIEESIDGMRAVFPFLAQNLNDEVSNLKKMFQSNGEEIDDGKFSLPNGYKDSKGCPFEHRNAGRDPKCGTTEMDEETINLVKKLSNRDVAVYKAAVERFELQLEVLSEYRAGSL